MTSNVVIARSLVKETSSTTGTGSYTLTGAATDFRTFNAAYGNGATIYVPYVARQGSDFEIGIGTLSAATTLQRTSVIESSNSNLAVNWTTAPVIYSALGGGAGPMGKHDFDATAQPSNSATAGFGPGSIVHAYIAAGSGHSTITYLYVTDAAGAKFVPIAYHTTLQPLKDVSLNIGLNGLLFGGGVDRVMDGTVTGVMASGDGGKARWKRTHLHGLGWDSTQSDVGAHQFVDNLGFVQVTTDATPTLLYLQGSSTQYMTMEASSCLLIEATLVARCHADNNHKAWKIQCAVKRNTTGDPAIIGSVTYTVIANDAGAAAWDITVGVDTTNDAVTFTATGAAAKTIRWSLHVQATQVAET